MKDHWWEFKFPFYVSYAHLQIGDMFYCRTRKLGFFSYWAIRLIHGIEKIREMSSHAEFEKEFGLPRGFVWP